MEHLHSAGFMPHGYCYLWLPDLVFLHVASDTLIFLSYATISFMLYRLRRKVNLPFNGMVFAFGLFIAACGFGHAVDVWNLWNANYYFSGFVKAITALASVSTAIWMFPLAPKILKFADAARLSEQRRKDLEQAYSEVEERVRQRTQDLEESNRREKEAREQAEALYESAQRANRMRDEFLASVSHELRTPLGVILGWSDLLVRGHLKGEEFHQAILTIQRNAELQQKLVEDLLDLSRIRSGQLRLHVGEVNLNGLVQEVAGNLKLAAEKKGIELVARVEPKEFLTHGDSVRLSQVVWNLLNNAIKFTDRGGKITVTVERLPLAARISVNDTGAGISPEFLPVVFRKFTQEEGGRKQGGLGLGLSIVRHIVELHGGKISAHSEGKGLGSTFTVELPLSLNSEEPWGMPFDKAADS